MYMQKNQQCSKDCPQKAAFISPLDFEGRHTYKVKFLVLLRKLQKINNGSNK